MLDFRAFALSLEDDMKKARDSAGLRDREKREQLNLDTSNQPPGVLGLRQEWFIELQSTSGVVPAGPM